MTIYSITWGNPVLTVGGPRRSAREALVLVERLLVEGQRNVKIKDIITGQEVPLEQLRQRAAREKNGNGGNSIS